MVVGVHREFRFQTDMFRIYFISLSRCHYSDGNTRDLAFYFWLVAITATMYFIAEINREECTAYYFST